MKHPRRFHHRRRRRAGLTAALVLILLAAPGAAWALWSHQAQLAASASAGMVQAPGNLRCETDEGILELIAPSAVLTWEEPASGPPHGYQIIVSDGETTEVVRTLDGQGQSAEITRGLLSSVVSSLLGLLLGGADLTVSVVATHSSGWTSTPSNAIEIEGHLTGVGCA